MIVGYDCVSEERISQQSEKPGNPSKRRLPGEFFISVTRIRKDSVKGNRMPFKPYNFA